MNQKGFAPLIIIVIATLVISAGVGGFLLLPEKKTSSSEKMAQQEISPEDITSSMKTQPELKPKSAPPTSTTKPAPSQKLLVESRRGYWEGWETYFKPVGVIPICPDPLVISLPVDRAHMTSILYPGQYRGGAVYKAHGGFRLDRLSDTRAEVRIPLDADLIYGSRHITQGEVQYMLGFRMPCGIEYRLDHLRVLEPMFEKRIHAHLPFPKTDSLTTNFNPPIPVKAGEVIAIEVGFANPLNVGFDFGVYDLRKKNKMANDPEWVKAREGNLLASYAICWFDLLAPEDEKFVRSLPAADWASGAQSDFCE